MNLKSTGGLVVLFLCLLIGLINAQEHCNMTLVCNESICNISDCIYKVIFSIKKIIYPLYNF